MFLVLIFNKILNYFYFENIFKTLKVQGKTIYF